MRNLIEELTDIDDKKAYAWTKEIAAVSERSPEYYSQLETFASLLNDKKSYIRTRAFILCCSQARWDDEGRLEQLLPRLTALFHDPKPTVVRQCLNAVKEIVVFRPELSGNILQELDRMDLPGYKGSMSNLIRADIAELRELIEEATPKIRALSQTELENSLPFVWKVFLEFEAVKLSRRRESGILFCDSFKGLSSYAYSVRSVRSGENHRCHSNKERRLSYCAVFR